MSKHIKPLPKHLSIPGCRSFQVRIKRGTTIHSKTFPWHDGGYFQAQRKACAWRDTMLASLPKSAAAKGSVRSRPHANKTNDLPSGVSCYIHTDNRSVSARRYFRYSVLWYDGDGDRRIKSFNVGAIGSITQRQRIYAKKTAIAFRQAWERSNAADRPFHPETFRDWRVRQHF